MTLISLFYLLVIVTAPSHYLLHMDAWVVDHVGYRVVEHLVGVVRVMHRVVGAGESMRLALHGVYARVGGPQMARHRCNMLDSKVHCIYNFSA